VLLICSLQSDSSNQSGIDSRVCEDEIKAESSEYYSSVWHRDSCNIFGLGSSCCHEYIYIGMWIAELQLV